MADNNKNNTSYKNYNDCNDSSGFIVGDGDSCVYHTQCAPTFEKVWLMFQESKLLMKEQSRETDKKWKETDRKWKETDKRFKETERLVRDVTKNIGGLNNSVGEVAEEYFFRALEKLPEVAGVKIQRVGKLYGQTKELQREYDVVLFGRNALIAVEVKHKLETNDVIVYCEKSLPVLKQLFPEYAAYKVIGGVAGMSAKKGAVKLAIEKGLLVFTQTGQKLWLRNPEGFEPKVF